MHVTVSVESTSKQEQNVAIMKGMLQSELQHIHLLKNTPLVSSKASCSFSMHPVVILLQLPLRSTIFRT